MLYISSIQLSGWGDSNSRPRRPERRALTGLRHTPNLRIYISQGQIHRKVKQ